MKRITVPSLSAALAFLTAWAGTGLFLSRDDGPEETILAVPVEQRPDALTRENSAAAVTLWLDDFSASAKTAGDLESALESIRKLPSESLRIAALKLLASELDHLELEEGLELAGNLTGKEQDAFLETLLERWNDSHSAESLAMALSEFGIVSRAAWLKAVAKETENDPQTALELVNRFHLAKMDIRFGFRMPSSASATIRSAILTEWAKTDPVAAAASWEKQTFEGIGWTRNPVANVWFESDPAAALAWLESAKVPHTSFHGFVRSLAAESHEKVLDLVRHMPDLLDRPGFSEAVAKGWAEDDPDAAITWLELNVASPDRVQKAIRDMIRNNQDLDTQRTLLDRLPEGSNNRLEAVRAVAGSWGEKGDADALAWARSLEHPKESEKAVFRVLWSWAEEHPELLIEHRQELVEAGFFETEDGQLIMGDLAGSHPELAREWIQVLPEDLKKESAKGVAWTLAQKDPPESAKFVDALSDPAAHAQAAQRVVAIWTRSDPRAAAAWVETLPEGKGRDYAFGNLVKNWSRHEPAAAEAWLSAQPPSSARDRAAAGFVEITAWLDPAAAFRWASTIQKGDARNEALRQALKPWARRDPKAASAAIANLPVEPLVREELEAMVADG